MREIRLRTERRSQLVDITRDVRAAVDPIDERVDHFRLQLGTELLAGCDRRLQLLAPSDLVAHGHQRIVSATSMPTASISISPPVTSLSMSSADWLMPSDQSSRSSDPASRSLNQSLP